MAEASQWRSSEYSERAEELFSDYVRARRAGAAPEFEDFCAQHPELEDELCGLLTDWENVGGVVERLIAEPATQAPRPPAPAAPAPPVAKPKPKPRPAPPPEPAREPAAAPPRRSYVLPATSAVLLAAVGTFAFLEWRGGQTLAAERDEIAQLQEQTAELAERAVERSTELSEENQELETRAERSERERQEAEQARLDAEARARASEEAAARATELMESQAAWGALERDVAALPPSAPGADIGIETLRARATQLAAHLTELDAHAPLSELEQELDRLAGIAMAARAEREAWAAAGEAIAAHPAYAGVVLSPQEGLAPLGEDPDSGLWEFAWLATGAAPARDDEGALQLTDESALVLVLVPPAAERPAFLMARAALTSAQWERAGGDPQVEPTAVEYALVLASVGLKPASAAQLAAAGVTPAQGDLPLAARALED